LAVLLGLLAAACYGASDFLGGLATRRSSIFAVTILSQGVGFVLLLLALPFVPAHLTGHVMLYGFLSGVCGGAGIALLYHALSIGKMGVVSPITAVLAAAIPVAIGLVRGEQLSPWQSAGIGVALLAVVLISLSTEPDGRLEFSTAGVKEAIASGILLGGFYVFLALAGRHAGLYPLVFARIGSVGILLLTALAARGAVALAKGTLAIVVLAGVIDMTANGLYLYASYTGYLAIAAVLTSLYPASTVFLARVVLKERLAAIQKAGVVLALAGVALIAW
jgi:drug/metabolite transporter (DMT)-like permease